MFQLVISGKIVWCLRWPSLARKCEISVCSSLGNMRWKHCMMFQLFLPDFLCWSYVYWIWDCTVFHCLFPNSHHQWSRDYSIIQHVLCHVYSHMLHLCLLAWQMWLHKMSIIIQTFVLDSDDMEPFKIVHAVNWTRDCHSVLSPTDCTGFDLAIDLT